MTLGLVVLTVWSTVVPWAASPAQPPADDESVVIELAERYAPYVMVQQQPEPCGDGEAYDPSDVSVVLGQPDVVLRAESGEVLVTAPTDLDLAAAPLDSNIDLPGDAGNPECDFEQRFGRAVSTTPSTLYVRLGTDSDHPDRIALQYWMYFVYNDWNNLHEGDWEMAQVVFDASSAREALDSGPVGMAISQHNGNERRPWDEVTRVGDRPVVYAAVGSHAVYYSSHHWFGKSGAAGFGCDDTRGPSDQLDPRLVVMPDVVTPGDGFGWLTFPGRWGERLPSLNDSETGPPTKEQWIHPITWMDEQGRDSAVTVPELGGVTEFFCTATEVGSKVLNGLFDRPLLIGAILAAFVLGVIALVKRTRWSPVIPQPLATRRGVGQTIRSAFRLVVEHRHAFLPISALMFAGGVLAAILQYLIDELSAGEALFDVIDRSSATAGAVALLIGATVAVPIAVVGLGSAMVATDYVETDKSGWTALRTVWRSGVLRPLIVLTLTVVVGWIVLPIALFLIARWAVAPAAAMRRHSTLGEALHTSTQLTHGVRTRTLLTAVAGIVLVVFAGLFIGTIVLILLDVSFGFVNVISGAVAAVLIPWFGVVIRMYHADLVLRAEDRAAVAAAT